MFISINQLIMRTFLKNFTGIIVVLLIASCGSSKKIASDPYPLNGEWKPVREEMAGQPMPAAYFKSHLLVIRDSTYTFTAESVDKGISAYANGKMDITGKEGVNTGRTFKALYELNSDTLKICYNLKGDTYPASFSTQGNPLYFLAVFVKNK